MQVYHVGRLEIELDPQPLKRVGGALFFLSLLALALVFGWPFLGQGGLSMFLASPALPEAVPETHAFEATPLRHARSLPTPEPSPTPPPVISVSAPVIYTVQPERLVTLTGNWHPGEATSAEKAVTDVALRLAETLAAQATPLPPTDAFLRVFDGPVEFRRVAETCAASRAARGLTLPCGDGIWGETLSRNLVLVFVPTTPTQLITHPRWFVHELGHTFSQAAGNAPENDVPLAWTREALFAGPLNVWQFSSSPTQNEIFADLFLAWVYATWGTDADGSALMTENMPTWLQGAFQIHP